MNTSGAQPAELAGRGKTALVDLLRGHATRTPDNPCLTFEGETFSFRNMDERSSRVAHALQRQGVGAGERVAVIARNSTIHYELFYGCAKSAAIMLPINWRLSSREVGAILADAAPRLVLVSAEFRSLLVSAPTGLEVVVLEDGYASWRDSAPLTDPRGDIALEDPALILYTSGTTGLPKGAMLSHGNLSYVECTAREMWRFTSDSVNLVAMPLFHIGGIGYGMMALSQGGHTVLLQQPTPALVLEVMRKYAVTHAFFVPAVIQLLVDLPGASEVKSVSLRRMMYGASPISESLLRRAIEVFGCEFNHAYGMTETAGTVITLAPEDHDPGGARAHRLRSCGLPLPWVEMKLVDPASGDEVPAGQVGEIRVRSPMNMLGYWRKPAETSATTAKDGWLCTGDAAYRDTDGYVYIHDRYKDMIVSGGENVFPTEIENVLAQHPDVAEVAVIGFPHPKWGESPTAFIVRRAGSSPEQANLIAFVRERLAHYKCPSAIVFVNALPRTPSGKILKREMRSELWLRSCQ